MSKGNEPAYPAEHHHKLSTGLTKRELIAAMTLSGLLTYEPEFAAQMAVRHADALLAELERSA